MIGLDTNILVRYFTHDDPGQTPIALTFMDSLSPENQGFISLIVLVELVWVLDTFFQTTRSEIAQSLETLLRTKELIIDHADVAWRALAKFRAGNCQFADYLIECSGASAGCHHTATFDRRAAKNAGMKLLS